jgi:hypothetical protein
MERQANYDRRKLMEKAFEPDPEQNFPNSSGNVAHELEITRDTRKCQFHSHDDDPPTPAGDITAKMSGWAARRETYASLYEAIPSALLLYRLICTFGPVKLDCEGNEGYKMVWYYVLNHKPTNTKIAFSEWKGASGFHTTFHTYKQMPEELRNDLLALIEYLLSDECAHPYDGLTAGSVA